MPKFVPGLKLSKLFYKSKVKPILSSAFPRVPHSAALIGWGSEVLGFDTHVSRDHHWGPSDYYGRPYSVIFAERFANAIKQAIEDLNVKRIETDIGSIDQFTDSTDVN